MSTGTAARFRRGANRRRGFPGRMAPPVDTATGRARTGNPREVSGKAAIWLIC